MTEAEDAIKHYHQLARDGNYAELVQAIDADQCNPETMRLAPSGAMIWHTLAKAGHYAVLVQAINEGRLYSENARSTNSDATIWHWLAFGGHYDALITAIHEGRCDPDLRTNGGASIWHWLAMGGHYKQLVQAIKSGLFDPNVVLTDGGRKVWFHFAFTLNTNALANAVLDANLDLEVLKESLPENKFTEIIELLDNTSTEVSEVISTHPEYSDLIYAILIMRIRETKQQHTVCEHYKKHLSELIQQKFTDIALIDEGFKQVFNPTQPEVWALIMRDMAKNFEIFQEMFIFLSNHLTTDTIDSFNDLLIAYREILRNQGEDKMLTIISPYLTKIYNNLALFADENQKQRIYKFWDSGIWNAVIPQAVHTTNSLIFSPAKATAKLKNNSGKAAPEQQCSKRLRSKN